MLLYIHLIKKYLYYLTFFFLLLLIVLLFKELSNLDFIISVYKEERNALLLILNSIIVFLPFALPIVVFYSTNFWFAYLKNANILKRISLSGYSYEGIYILLFIINFFFVILTLLLNNHFVPLKIYENNFLLRKIQIEKPYITLEPLIFNRVGKEYLVYFREFGNDKKEIKNVIVYKFKKGIINNITHVEKGYMDREDNLILTNGISIVLGDSGESGKPVYLDERINKNEIIEKGIFDEAFSPVNIPDNMTTFVLLESLKKSKGKTNYFELYEIHRRFLLSFSFFFFLFISLYLFSKKNFNDRNIVFAVTSVLSFVFILKEIYIKLLLKNIIYSISINLWLVDISVFAVILIILRIISNRRKT